MFFGRNHGEIAKIPFRNLILYVWCVYAHESVQATSKIDKNTKAKKVIFLLFYFYLYQKLDYNDQN
jgi:hypothetical protein